MYVLTFSWDNYSPSDVLAASTDLSKLEDHLKGILEENARNSAAMTYVYDMMHIWHDQNPTPVCPFEKPPFDHARANDKEYVKARNAGPIAEWHANRSRWYSQVQEPWEKSQNAAHKKYVEDAKTAELKIGPLDNEGYSIIHVPSV